MKFHRAVMTYLLLEGLTKACSGKESGSHHLRSKAESEYLFPSSGRILAKPVRLPDTNANAPPYCPGTTDPLEIILSAVAPYGARSCVSTNNPGSYGCNAQDLTYSSCKLVDPGGGCFTGCTGTCGEQTQVRLECKVINTSASARTVAWVLAEVLTRPSEACSSTITSSNCTLAFCAQNLTLKPKEEVPVTFPNPFNYTCGSVLSFRGNNVTAGGAIGALILGSAETSVTTCAGAFGTQDTCSGALGSKCGLPAGSLPITPPFSLSKLVPSADCVLGTSKPRQVRLRFSIVGGTAPYTVSIKCSYDTSTRALNATTISPNTLINDKLSAEGTYNYTGPECFTGGVKGFFTVNVSDNSTATDGTTCPGRSVTIDDPGCCVVNFPCKALTPPSTIVNGCTDDQFPPAKTRAEIFDLPNAEYCGDTETFSIDNTTTGSLCNEWTRTYTYTMSTVGSRVFTCTEIAVVKMQNIPTMEPLFVTEQCGETETSGIPSATDQCGLVLTPTIVGSRNEDFDYTTSSPKTCGTANNVNAVKMFREQYIATDACSNSKTVTKTITVVDTTKPSGRKLCNNPSTNLNCDTLAVPAVNSCVLADSCFGDLTGVPSCAVNNAAAEMVRTWTFTDPCGNTADEPHTATYKFAVAV